MSEDAPTRVAIACQGGGSHTAFTAGVLKGLLSEWDDGDELVGISGTSGGAFNALATWYGLAPEGEERAVELLDALWADLAADDLTDRVANDWVVGLSRIEASGLPVPQLGPYLSPGSRLGKERISGALERHIDFDAVPDLCRRDAPNLVIETVDINVGIFETFANELAGNISLNQEPRVIERVNEWIDEGHLPESAFSKTRVRRVTMGRAYHCSTKVDRSPSFLGELMDLGEQRAATFRVRLESTTEPG